MLPLLGGPAPSPAALPAGAVARLNAGDAGAVVDAAVSPDGSTIAGATARGDLRLWHAADGTAARVLPAESAAVSIEYAADGARLAAAYSDGSVRVWDPRDGTLVRRLMAHPRSTRALALSPDGTLLAGGGDDGVIHVIDAETANPLRRFAPAPEDGAGGRAGRQQRPVSALAFSPDGAALVSAHWPSDPFAHVWDPRTGVEVARLREGGEAVAAVVFSPDGATLATAGDDGQRITLWETATWRVRARLDSRGAAEFPRAFSPDGRTLWSATGTEVWAWDLATGRRVGKLSGERRNLVTCVAPFPSGTKLVTGDNDGAITVWDGALAIARDAPAAAQGQWRPEGLWGALAGEDAAAAYDAIRALAAAPEQSVPYLRNRLPRQDPADTAQVRQLIAQLDHEQFTVRERATRELAKLGDAAEAPLREQLSETKSPEVGQRIEVLLEALRHGVADADVLRALRAAEVLERVGTPAAAAALAELAAASPSAKVKERAAGAVRRINLRRTPNR